MKRELVWDAAPKGSKSKPASSSLLAEFEKQHAVRLPKEFHELYRLQNGGTLNGVRSPELLLTIAAGKTRIERMHVAPMASWPKRAISANSLEFVTEEFGDPRRIISFAEEGGGHVMFALNYNGRKKEASVIRVDLEGPHGKVVAKSFGQWLKSLEAEEELRACPIDWSEHKKHRVLFQEMAISRRSGVKHVTETIVSEPDTGGLLILERRSSPGAEQVQRILFPKGLEGSSLHQTRQNGRGRFQLEIRARLSKKNHVVFAESNGKSSWKVDAFKGDQADNFTIYSARQDRLKTLQRDLHRSSDLDSPSRMTVEEKPPRTKAELERSFARYQRRLRREFLAKKKTAKSSKRKKT